MICEYCKCNIVDDKKVIGTHLRSCNEYIKFRDYLISSLTYDFLFDEYVTNEKSIKQIAREMGFKKPNFIHSKLIEYGIHIRDASENRKAKGYINLTNETCLLKYGVKYHTLKDSPIRDKIWNGVKEKYGVKNLFELPNIQNKIKNTCLEKYGCENPSQSEEIQDKIKNTCLLKYGTTNVFQNKDVINKIKQTKSNNNFASSHYSIKASDFFNKLYQRIYNKEHIYFSPMTKEFCIMSDEKKLYCYDFVDTKNKKCIEYNGNYWHGNPNIYSKKWVNKHNGMTISELHDRDTKKCNEIIKRGFDVMTIWECDCDTNEELMINKCISFINKI